MNPTRELSRPAGNGRLARVRRLTSRRPGTVPVDALVALPSHLAPEARLVVVMHGVRRNAREYLESWRAWSQEIGRPVLAPHFEAAAWPGARAYNLGNILDSNGRRNPVGSWAFTALRHLVVDTRRGLQLTNHTWDLFGHSAGAQFAHRFVLLSPSATLSSVVVAGAGWFTQPDPTLDWPYGTRHPELGLDRTALTAWTRGPLVLMRGEHDRHRDEHLRTGPDADAQGLTRWNRAAAMLAAGRAYDPQCRWELVDVRGAAHHEAQMALAAQDRWHTPVTAR